jgi:hypothetical protein
MTSSDFSLQQRSTFEFWDSVALKSDRDYALGSACEERERRANLKKAKCLSRRNFTMLNGLPTLTALETQMPDPSGGDQQISSLSSRRTQD